MVIFTQYRASLTLLEGFFKLKQYSYQSMHGDTLPIRRGLLVEQFNATGSKDFIFALTTKTGGQGLNLQSADTVILFETSFNPQDDIQAMARVHRIGQTKVRRMSTLLRCLFACHPECCGIWIDGASSLFVWL